MGRETGARRTRGESVNEEGGRGRRDRLVPLDWIPQVVRVYEARQNGPRSAVKGQSTRRNKDLREREVLVSIREQATAQWTP